MKIMMISAEFSPFAKTGGLADAVSSLSIALKQLKKEVEVIADEYSRCFQFLPYQEEIKRNSNSNYDLAIALDCATSFLKLKDYLPDRDYYLHVAPESNGSILVI